MPATPAPNSGSANEQAKPIGATPILDTIRTLGRLLDDLERVRIMNSNRIAALERTYGDSLPHLNVIQEHLRAIEHQAELELVRAWRKHPLAPWAKAQRGVGEKSIARLIAEIGDPYLATIFVTESNRRASPDSSAAIALSEPMQRALPDSSEAIIETAPSDPTPRTVSQLWAYCGHGDPARSRIPKGATQEELFKRGKDRAKKQVWLIATGMLKAGNRELYDARRAATTDRVHVGKCPQCAAKPGDPWRDGHKHADALRIVGKEFLKQLWLAAQAIDMT